MDNSLVQHSIQSANSKMTTESINAIDAHLAANPIPNALTSTDALATVKKVWLVARPIVVFIESALFFSHTWHDALKVLVAAMDALTTEDTMPV